jgi:hypothetical protein
MPRLRPLALLALALLAACSGDGPLPDPDPPGSIDLDFDLTSAEVETVADAAFRTLRHDGSAAPGVTVHFTVVSGGAVLLADSAVSNAAGNGVVQVRLPAQPGASVIRATAADFTERTGTLTAVAGPPFTLEPASLRLVTGCNGLVDASLAGVPPPAVAYSVSDPAVVELIPFPGSGGAINRRLVRPLQPGTAQIVAYRAARADTVPLVVVSGADAVPGLISFGIDSVEMLVGVRDSYGATIYEQGGCGMGGTLTFASSAPDVASVDAEGVVTPLRAGTARIEASFGPVSDSYTVYVHEASALPADSTIRVGERLRYRLLVTGPSGEVHEPSEVFVSTDAYPGTILQVDGQNPGWVQGVSAGEARVWVSWPGHPAVWARVRLRVVP